MSVKRPTKRSLRPPRRGSIAPQRVPSRTVRRTASGLATPDATAVLAEVMELAGRAGLDLHDDEIIHAYVERFEKLLPRRMFCVRLLARDAASASLVYATSRLRSDKRDVVALSRDALQAHRLSLQAARGRGILVTSEYEPVFVRGANGFDVPLLQRDILIGTVCVEYERGASIPASDKPMLGQLARLLAGALTNVAELRELQDQIVQSEKLATLGQLAAGVVHELNNPLTSISVYGDYLLKRAISQRAEEADIEKLRRIVASADRILKFTRDLVTYARPSPEQPTAVDLVEVVELSVVFCAHVLDEVGATIEKTFDPNVPPVHAVKGQLVQVLVNLITNACHAMPLGAGRLRLEVCGADDGRVQLHVEDTGRGIPEENLKRIFDPFFSTKGEGQGTGLGLSIVRNIIQQHRGEIRVTSEVGRGTAFDIFLLPRVPAEEPGA